MIRGSLILLFPLFMYDIFDDLVIYPSCIPLDVFFLFHPCLVCTIFLGGMPEKRRRLFVCPKRTTHYPD